MDQQPLFCESFEEAIRGAVNSLKGPKAVGVMLWPELSADVAAKRLNHCLDPDRPEKLELSQVLLIAKRARLAGCHTVMGFLSQELDYAAPVAIDPESEVQRLQREYIAATAALVKLASRIEQRQTEIQSAPQLRRVA